MKMCDVLHTLEAKLPGLREEDKFPYIQSVVQRSLEAIMNMIKNNETGDKFCEPIMASMKTALKDYATLRGGPWSQRLEMAAVHPDMIDLFSRIIFDYLVKS